MNLYFSGGPRENLELDPRIPKGIRHRLMSCHFEYIRQARKTFDCMIATGEPMEIMLDSGAFTAWSKGKEVDLDDLIKIYDEMFEKYGPHAKNVWLISLDKIPGSRGVTASPEEIKEAEKISDQNFVVLQKRYGDRVLPVFHQNESSARLHEIAAMAPYICVSPRNDLHEDSRRSWSQEVHAMIPGKMTHGLAATGLTMMTRVPWFSVDSATWIMLAANGAIFRDVSLRALAISDQSSSLKDDGQHYRTMPPMVKDSFRSEVERRGFTVEGLEMNFFDRMLWNRVLMTEVYRSIPPQDVVARSTPVEQSLFDL